MLFLGATPGSSGSPLRATGRPGSLRASLGASCCGKSTGRAARSSRRSRAFFRVRVVRVVTSTSLRRGGTSAALIPNCRFCCWIVQNFGTARAASASRSGSRCSSSSSRDRRCGLFVGIRGVVDDNTFWNFSALRLRRRRRATTSSCRSRCGGCGCCSSTSLLRCGFRICEILVFFFFFRIRHFLVLRRFRIRLLSLFPFCRRRCGGCTFRSNS